MIRGIQLFKLVATIFLLSISSVNSFSQNTSDSGLGQNMNTREGSIDDLEVNPIRLPALQEVGGSPFLTSDYHTATIQTNKDIVVKEIPVRFNIYNNSMMVKMDDGQELKLESFRFVSYDIVGSDGVVKQIQFQQGLPDVDNHNNRSVYLVVSTGPKVQLLKYLSQKVEDAATLGDYSRRELVITEHLYISVPGGAIKHIKASKKDIVEALPSMSTKIDEITTANNLKLKTEAEITVLIEALNKP